VQRWRELGAQVKSQQGPVLSTCVLSIEWNLIDCASGTEQSDLERSVHTVNERSALILRLTVQKIRVGFAHFSQSVRQSISDVGFQNFLGASNVTREGRIQHFAVFIGRNVAAIC
jgi:hypothetical protein